MFVGMTVEMGLSTYSHIRIYYIIYVCCSIIQFFVLFVVQLAHSTKTNVYTIYTFKIKSVQKLFSIRSVESEYSTHPVLSNHQLATDTNMNIHADDALMGAPRNAD